MLFLFISNTFNCIHESISLIQSLLFLVPATSASVVFLQGCYWDALVHHLRSPVKHSLESFLLNDDHEIIRRFREALNGPPGMYRYIGEVFISILKMTPFSLTFQSISCITLAQIRSKNSINQLFGA